MTVYPFNEYIKAICELFDYSKKNSIYIDQSGRLLRGILRKERTLTGCKAGSSQITYYPDGSQTICTKLDLLNKKDFNEILPLLPINNKKCSDCIALNLCGGGCFWDAMVMPNNIGVDERLCVSKVSLVNYILSDINKEMENIESKDEAFNKIKDIYEPIM
jgi:radical SAM protein with 4Fe4S-binding SPASM domain